MKVKRILGSIVFLVSLLSVLSVVYGYSIKEPRAYSTQDPKWEVILANGNYGGLNEKWKYIDIDLTGGVNVDQKPSVPYYSVKDYTGDGSITWNSIAPPKGTKFLYKTMGSGTIKYWVSKGGSVNEQWAIQSNSKGRVRFENVDATGSTPYMRLPKVSKPGYTFTGWTVIETQLSRVYYNGSYQNFNGTTKPITKGSDGFYYMNVGAYSTNRTVKPTFRINQYYLDVNGLLDGNAVGNTSGYGTFDVYINGSLVANDVTDFYQQYDYGTKYEIKDIKSVTGKTYNGVSSGQINGTIGTYNSVQLKFSTTLYTNTISHWMFGFKNGEGNNSNKSAWFIGNTTFSQNYNTSFTMNSSRAKTIPKGFQLASSFGTSSIEGTWKSYAMGTSVTQKSNSMSFEYDYTPITYTISYNMNGGTNNSSNPTSYNILYGVTLQNPIRKGWSFEGWYLNGKKVSGINVGANAVFTSESDMYNKLNSRTSGNLTLEARWYNDPPVLDLDIDGGNTDGNPIPPIIKDDDTIVIQQNDIFTPSKYLDATDKESGEKLDISIDNKVPLDENNKAYQSGTYDVIYTATDEGGASSSFTLHVIVNEPPVITATDRIFFKGQQNVDSEELLRKVIAEDKEDGILTDRVTIVSIDYKDGRVDKNVKRLDTSKTGEFTITYTVTDNYKKTITKTATIKVVDNQSVVNSGTSSAIRFINLKFLNTLNSYSIWSTDSNYKSTLLNSLNQKTAKKYSSEKIQKMRE